MAFWTMLMFTTWKPLAGLCFALLVPNLPHGIFSCVLKMVTFGRCYHGAVGREDTLYIFGGINGADNLNDLYKLSISTGMWTKIDVLNPPSPRHGISLTQTSYGLLLLGGTVGQVAPEKLQAFRFAPDSGCQESFT